MVKETKHTPISPIDFSQDRITSYLIQELGIGDPQENHITLTPTETEELQRDHISWKEEDHNKSKERTKLLMNLKPLSDVDPEISALEQELEAWLKT